MEAKPTNGSTLHLPRPPPSVRLAENLAVEEDGVKKPRSRRRLTEEQKETRKEAALVLRAQRKAAASQALKAWPPRPLKEVRLDMEGRCTNELVSPGDTFRGVEHLRTSLAEEAEPLGFAFKHLGGRDGNRGRLFFAICQSVDLSGESGLQVRRSPLVL